MAIDMTKGPIRVLHLITSLGNGGAEMMLRKLVLGMDRTRFLNVVVCMTVGGVHTEVLRSAGIVIHCLDLKRGLPGPNALKRVAGICRLYRPHVLQGWMYHADAFGVGLRAVSSHARRAGWLWNVRCSAIDFRRYNPLTRFVIHGLASASIWPHAVIVNSWAGLRDHAALGYRPRRWIVLPNGFDTTAYAPDPSAAAWLRQTVGIPVDAPVATLVARVDPMKDHGTFLAAVAEAARKVPGLHAILVGRGTGPGGSLAGDIARLGLANRVHGLGERSDVARILAGSTCTALSSAFGEGFPNVIGEAMACATPCVVTDVGDAARIVGATGLVVPPSQPAAFATALATLAAEESNAHQRRGQLARERIVSHFSLPAVITAYSRVYAAVAARAN